MKEMSRRMQVGAARDVAAAGSVTGASVSAAARPQAAPPQPGPARALARATRRCRSRRGGSEEARAPAVSWQMLLAAAPGPGHALWTPAAGPRDHGAAAGSGAGRCPARGSLGGEREGEAARLRPRVLGLAPPASALGSERAATGAVCACAPVSRCLSCPRPCSRQNSG